MIIDYFKTALKKLKPVPLHPSEMAAINFDFTPNEKITIGIEIELQVIDRQTLDLTNKADDVLARVAEHSKQFVPELLKSQIEINSHVHTNANDLEQEIRDLLKLASEQAQAIDCEVTGGGCHPFGNYHAIDVRTDNRYKTLLERNQWTSRRWIANGMHIHLGMKSEHEFIRFMLFFENYIPHLIALSASSPFWQGSDTGLDSGRSVLGDSMPTAPLMYTVNSWAKFKNLAKTLKQVKGIRSLSDLHWDIRPNTGYGTLEIRVFDMPTNVSDVIALAALTHTMALWFSTQGEWLDQMPKTPLWMARENKWRALRYGMESEVIKDENGLVRPMRADILQLLDRIQETAVAHGYERHLENIRKIVKHGNSSMRQRAVYEATGSFKDVARHTIQEFKAGHPIYPDAAPGPAQRKAS
jgi:carboxylate-amine ligase